MYFELFIRGELYLIRFFRPF